MQFSWEKPRAPVPSCKKFNLFDRSERVCTATAIPLSNVHIPFSAQAGDTFICSASFRLEIWELCSLVVSLC